MIVTRHSVLAGRRFIGEVGTGVRRDVRPIGSEVHAARQMFLSLALFRSASYAHTLRDVNVPDWRAFAKTRAVTVLLFIAVLAGRRFIGEVGTGVRRDVRPIGSEVHAARQIFLSLALFRSFSYAHTRRDTHAAVVIRDVNVPDWRAFAEARAVTVLLRW